MKTMKVIRMADSDGNGAIVRVSDFGFFRSSITDYGYYPHHYNDKSLSKWVDLEGSGDFQYVGQSIDIFYKAYFNTYKPVKN